MKPSSNTPLATLRRQLAAKEAAFVAAKGSSVRLADSIAMLRAAIARKESKAVAAALKPPTATKAQLVARNAIMADALSELVKADDLRMGRKAVKLRLDIARQAIAANEGTPVPVPVNAAFHSALSDLLSDIDALSGEYAICREISESSYGIAARAALANAGAPVPINPITSTLCAALADTLHELDGLAHRHSILTASPPSQSVLAARDAANAALDMALPGQRGEAAQPQAGA